MNEPAQSQSNMRLVDDQKKAVPLRFRFTMARLAAVKVPAGKDRVYAFDLDCPGLAYMRGAGGTAKYYFHRKVNGETRRYPIADGRIAVEDARKIVRAELTEYAKGNDIRQRRIEERKQFTLQQLFLHWRKIEGNKKRSIVQYEYLFENYAAPLHGRRINTIQQHEIAKLHAGIAADGNRHHLANRVLAVLSIIFRWAHAHYHVPNPVKGVKRFPEYARERFLQPHELVAFEKAIEAEPDPTWKDFWRLLLATGQRRDNVCAMRWDDVDLIAKVWRIPAHTAKGKKAVTVPLSEAALQILHNRQDAREHAAWVFPSHGAAGRLKSPKKAWQRLLDRAKLDGLRMHDVRRTVGSYMAMSGVSDRLIGGALGQTTAQATNVYARLRAEPVREAMLLGMKALEAAKAAAEAEAKAQKHRQKPPRSNADASDASRPARKTSERGKRA